MFPFASISIHSLPPVEKFSVSPSPKIPVLVSALNEKAGVVASPLAPRSKRPEVTTSVFPTRNAPETKLSESPVAKSRRSAAPRESSASPPKRSPVVPARPRLVPSNVKLAE